MNEDVKVQVLLNHLAKEKYVLPEDPTIGDLLNFSNLRRPKKWRRNKRLFKKFRKNLRKYVSEAVRNEYTAKLFARPIKHRLDYESIGRKLVFVQALPEGALPDYRSIDERIDAWHESDDPRPLHEYLGMTPKEYALWVEEGKLKNSRS